MAERGPNDPGDPLGKAGRRLTKRQVEIVGLLAKGMHHEEIATRLGISIRTVEDHYAGMRLALGTKGVGDTVLEARRRSAEP